MTTLDLYATIEISDIANSIATDDHVAEFLVQLFRKLTLPDEVFEAVRLYAKENADDCPDFIDPTKL